MINTKNSAMKRDELQKEHLDIVLKHYETNKRGLAHLSMRYGKTKFTFEILKKLFNYDCTILVCYPNNDIKKSWEKEALKWGYSNPNITYVNFSSLYKYNTKIFDIVIGDEIHQLSDFELLTLQEIITNDENTYFLGLSGTLSKETQERIGIPVVVEYLSSEAISDGVVGDYNISVHLVDLDTKVKTPNKKGKMLSEKQRYDNYSFVIRRMQQDGDNAMFLALSRTRIAIQSINKKAYLLKLLEKLKDKRYLVFTGLSAVADELPIPSYHSKSKDDSNLQLFQDKKINHLALVEKGKLGLSYVDLDGIILLNFTHNSENTAQGVFRAGILDYAGKCSEIHIIAINEKPELVKLENSLRMLDKSKVRYL